MSYLVDTCVISELTKSRPDAGVVEWFGGCPEDQIFISSLTLGELNYGIALLQNGKKKNDLIAWYNRFAESFKESTIPVTDSIAVRWGTERAGLRRTGKQLAVIDGLIACSAVEHNLVLVTRNTKDYQAVKVRLFNPWQ